MTTSTAFQAKTVRRQKNKEEMENKTLGRIIPFETQYTQAGKEKNNRNNKKAPPPKEIHTKEEKNNMNVKQKRN